MDIHIWVPRDPLGGIHGYLGGTDGTLRPMGPAAGPDRPGPAGPARLAASTGPGSRARPREEGAGATDEREVAPAAWGCKPRQK